MPEMKDVTGSQPRSLWIPALTGHSMTAQTTRQGMTSRNFRTRNRRDLSAGAGVRKGELISRIDNPGDDTRKAAIAPAHTRFLSSPGNREAFQAASLRDNSGGPLRDGFFRQLRSLHQLA